MGKDPRLACSFLSFRRNPHLLSSATSAFFLCDLCVKNLCFLRVASGLVVFVFWSSNGLQPAETMHEKMGL
jgi:hypothetical protein